MDGHPGRHRHGPAPDPGLLLTLAGGLQTVRLLRWAGDRTWRDRLVLVLHIAYAFIPLGFFLAAAAAFGWLAASTGNHAWAAGAAGLMVLAIMSRASLGHTGRPLVASRWVQSVYGMLIGAAILRICAALDPSLTALLPLAWLG